MSARQRFNNNYLELSKENVLRNIILSHWPCFTWKSFMIWFHKILKLILKQPSCPRNIFTEHWRKLPNLTAFLEVYLYLKSKSNDSVEHVQTVLLNVLFIYFSLCKISKSLMLFLKAQASFPSNFASIFSAIKHNSSVLFLAQTLYTLVKGAN